MLLCWRISNWKDFDLFKLHINQLLMPKSHKNLSVIVEICMHRDKQLSCRRLWQIQSYVCGDFSLLCSRLVGYGRFWMNSDDSTEVEKLE